MKKIVALLSFHFWYNYGTCFQSYALWKALQILGVESEYLNFGWKYPINQIAYWDNNWSYTKKSSKCAELKYRLRKYKDAIINHSFLHLLYYDYITISNNKKFDSFHKDYIKESYPINNAALTCVENNYSMFIVGSDQVWNPDTCDKQNLISFLLFFIKEKTKTASYASSIGRSSVNEHTETLYKQYLSSFKFLSCRESTGCNILKRCLNRDVQKVVDPTLLITHAQWLSFAKISTFTQKYVLCYILGENESIVLSALGYADPRGFLIRIVTSSRNLINKYHKYIVSNTGPREFLGLLENSQCLFTDSFHGTALALNFNKIFYAFYKRDGGYEYSDNSRILDFLRDYGLENRLIIDDTIIDENIDYEEVNRVIESQRQYGYNYLRMIVSNI